MHAYNSSTGEVEAEESQVQFYPQLHNELKDSLN